MQGTGKAVLAAFVGNVAIAVVKFVGAFFSGSSALLAEAVHSVVDTLNQVFLSLGLMLGGRPPTSQHPFGFGPERFFWSLMAAVFIFFGGALINIAEGISKWMHPAPIKSAAWAIGVLVFAFMAEGSSLLVSLREGRKRAERLGMRLDEYLKMTRDATLLTVVLEDSGALVGIVIAALGVGLTLFTGNGHFDGAASIAIGLLLAVMAFVLGGKTHGLLIGQAAAPQVLQAIEEVMGASPAVRRVSELYTVHIAPRELLLAARVELDPEQVGEDVGKCLDQLEASLKERVPILKHIFIDVEARGTVDR